jgi:hypothetical protein
MAKAFVYHRKTKNFDGDTLYPLNVLKTEKPMLYTEAVKKYAGREWLLDVIIPPLDCQWNDVVHCSPIHPSLLYRTLLETGWEAYRGRSSLWFEIPIETIENPSVIYLNNRIWQDTKTLLAKDFEPVSPERVSGLSGMPEENEEYYRECKKAGTPPLLWKRAPHVLVRSAVNVEKYRVLDWIN